MTSAPYLCLTTWTTWTSVISQLLLTLVMMSTPLTTLMAKTPLRPVMARTPRCQLPQDRHNITLMTRRLGQLVEGAQVFHPWSRGYEQHRAIHLKVCCQKPAIIIVPKTVQDVSLAVQFSRQEGLQLSVRSGGHSYTCTSLKDGSLHLDLRSLDKVNLVSTNYSNTGLAAVLGPGSTWDRVIKIIPFKRYRWPPPRPVSWRGSHLYPRTVPGYWSGWLSHWRRIQCSGHICQICLGIGALNVLGLEVVLADGSIAWVEEGKTIVNKPGGTREVVKNKGDQNLFFALRGAGSSFGIVTEFLYKVWDRPETLPAVILVYLDTLQDFKKLEKAAQSTDRFAITAYKFTHYTKGIFPFNLQPWNLPYVKNTGRIPMILGEFYMRLMSRNKYLPLFVTVTDVSPTAPRKTDPSSALSHLASHGVRLFSKDPSFVSMVTDATGYLLLYDYKSGFMSDGERRVLGGTSNYVGSTNGGLQDSMGVADAFLHHPLLGHRRESRRTKAALRELGCDYCWWGFNFDNHLRKIPDNPRTAANTNIGKFQWDLSCMFRNPKSACPKLVKQFKRSIDSNPRLARVNSRPPMQYANTPGCEQGDFGERYWGAKYGRLKRVKKFWDPENVFNHCQSVGSTDVDCCPF